MPSRDLRTTSTPVTDGPRDGADAARAAHHQAVAVDRQPAPHRQAGQRRDQREQHQRPRHHAGLRGKRGEESPRSHRARPPRRSRRTPGYAPPRSSVTLSTRVVHIGDESHACCSVSGPKSTRSNTDREQRCARRSQRHRMVISRPTIMKANPMAKFQLPSDVHEPDVRAPEVVDDQPDQAEHDQPEHDADVDRRRRPGDLDPGRGRRLRIDVAVTRSRLVSAVFLRTLDFGTSSSRSPAGRPAPGPRSVRECARDPGRTSASLAYGVGSSRNVHLERTVDWFWPGQRLPGGSGRVIIRGRKR